MSSNGSHKTAGQRLQNTSATKATNTSDFPFLGALSISLEVREHSKADHLGEHARNIESRLPLICEKLLAL